MSSCPSAGANSWRAGGTPNGERSCNCRYSASALLNYSRDYCSPQDCVGPGPTFIAHAAPTVPYNCSSFLPIILPLPRYLLSCFPFSRASRKRCLGRHHARSHFSTALWPKIITDLENTLLVWHLRRPNCYLSAPIYVRYMHFSQTYLEAPKCSAASPFSDCSAAGKVGAAIRIIAFFARTYIPVPGLFIFRSFTALINRS